MKKWLLVPFVVFALTNFQACTDEVAEVDREDAPVAEDSFGDQADEVGDDMEEATESAGDQLEEMGNDVERGVEDAAD